MTNSIYTKLFAGFSLLASLLAPCYVSAQTPSIDSKDVTEVVISGQQNASHWFQAESPHFIVYSDAKHEDVSRLLEKLERLDHLLRTYTQSENKADAGPKLTFYYLKHHDDLTQINTDQPSYAIGLYTSCAAGVQGFGAHMFYRNKATSSLEKQPENEGLSYIFAAYARHFIYRYSDLRAPTWYIDGFAQYFANTRFSETETVVGMAPDSIGEYLQFLSGHRRSLDYQDILLQNDSKGHNYAGKAGVRLEFEARSWVLTHYILSSSDNIQHFRTYLNLVNKGMEQTQAFEQVFGYKMSRLGTELQRYKYKAEALKLNFSAGTTSDISFNSLPISANDLLLADAALKSCPDAKLGASLLADISKTAQKFPSSDYAQSILSRAQIDWGNPQDSITFLTAKNKAAKPEFNSVYLLGLAQLRLAEKNQGDLKKAHLENAQRNLLKACTLNPQAAEAFYAYFKAGVLAQETPSEEVLGSAILAWKQAREVNAYTRAAVLAYAYAGRAPEAQSALTLLTQNSRDPQMAGWAKSWQARINTGVSRIELLAEMRIEPTPNPRFSEWTVANAEVMKAVTLAAGTEAATSVIKELQMKSQQAPSQGGASQ